MAAGGVDVAEYPGVHGALQPACWAGGRWGRGGWPGGRSAPPWSWWSRRVVTVAAGPPWCYPRRCAGRPGERRRRRFLEQPARAKRATRATVAASRRGMGIHRMVEAPGVRFSHGRRRRRAAAAARGRGSSLTWLAVEQGRPPPLAAYRRDPARLLAWLHGRGPPPSARSRRRRCWPTPPPPRLGPGRASVAPPLVAVRTMHRFLAGEDLLPADPPPTSGPALRARRPAQAPQRGPGDRAARGRRGRRPASGRTV